MSGFRHLKQGGVRLTETEDWPPLVAHDSLWAATLLNYSALRIYQVVDLKGKVYGEDVGQMDYLAPDNKKPP